jgi:hypothetical protein
MLCRVKGEGGDIIGLSGVADETSCCVGVEGYHEEECLGLASVDDGMVEEGKTYEVMGIPERLKALFTDHQMGSSVHQKHNE